MSDRPRPKQEPGEVEATCPWCGSNDVERLSTFGPTHMTEQWYCRACRSPFERVRRRDGAERSRAQRNHQRRGRADGVSS